MTSTISNETTISQDEELDDMESSEDSSSEESLIDEEASEREVDMESMLPSPERLGATIGKKPLKSELEIATTFRKLAKKLSATKSMKIGQGNPCFEAGSKEPAEDDLEQMMKRYSVSGGGSLKESTPKSPRYQTIRILLDNQRRSCLVAKGKLTRFQHDGSDIRLETLMNNDNATRIAAYFSECRTGKGNLGEISFEKNHARKLYSASVKGSFRYVMISVSMEPTTGNLNKVQLRFNRN